MIKAKLIGNRNAPLEAGGQLALGLGFMLVVSLAAHMALNPEALNRNSLTNTIVAAIFAHMFGYFSYRRFDVFPGMTSTSAIFPNFLFAYCGIFVVIILFRMEYSRSQLVISLLSSIAWYMAAGAVIRRIKPYRLAVVPVGKASDLFIVKGVSWVTIGDESFSTSDVHGVVVDLRADLSDEWERFITNSALAGTPVYHFKQVIESLTGQVQIEHLSENTLGSLNPNQIFIGFKQVVDWLFAFMSIFFLSPILLMAAAAVRLDSSGPVLFRQKRMGYRGRVFEVYKFRTMRGAARCDHGADRARAITSDSDARITRVGAILRRTRIDELPQILNILRGEMSWIGPRPEALALSQWYEAELPYYRYRHIVRPGITGWAQVNQGHVTELGDALEKLHYDFYYIKNLSPFLDFVIAARTVAIVVTGFGAR